MEFLEALVSEQQSNENAKTENISKTSSVDSLAELPSSINQRELYTRRQLYSSFEDRVNTLCSAVTGNDKDYLRLIPRVVW
jgi:hypothetical protein